MANEMNEMKARELLALYNEAEKKLFSGGKEYQQIGDYEFTNLQYQIRQCGYKLRQPKIGLSTLKKA